MWRRVLWLIAAGTSSAVARSSIHDGLFSKGLQEILEDDECQISRVSPPSPLLNCGRNAAQSSSIYTVSNIVKEVDRPSGVTPGLYWPMIKQQHDPSTNCRTDSGVLVIDFWVLGRSGSINPRGQLLPIGLVEWWCLYRNAHADYDFLKVIAESFYFSCSLSVRIIC